MARNKFDVDETLESPFQWKHLKRAFQYIGRHRFQMIGALALSVLATVPLLIFKRQILFTFGCSELLCCAIRLSDDIRNDPGLLPAFPVTPA